MNVIEASEIWNITTRRIRKLCEEGKIEGTKKIKNTWYIPDDTIKPIDRRFAKRKTAVIVCNSIYVSEILAKRYKLNNFEVIIISEEKSYDNNFISYKCKIDDSKKMCSIFNNIEKIDSLLVFPSSYLPKTIDETTEQEFDYYSNLIIKHVYNTIKYSVEKVRKVKGNIIIMHSSVAINPEVGATIYSMLQASLIMLCKTLAIREGNYGVRVNNIALGPAKTDKVKEKVTLKQFKYWKGINPLGVTFKIEDCLDLVINIALGIGGYSKMNGAIISLDGGESIADNYVFTQKGGETL